MQPEEVEGIFSLFDDFVDQHTSNPSDARWYNLTCRHCGGPVILVECKGNSIGIAFNPCCKKLIRRKRKRLHITQKKEYWLWIPHES